MTPKQKPGRSKQDYKTPPEFLEAVKKRFRISEFALDLAASNGNNVCLEYYTKENDSLRKDLSWESNGVAWLNPPYSNIRPWVKKAHEQTLASNLVDLFMLLPAAVGSNWFRDYVNLKCRIILLNGRIRFVGASGPYPKDCMLLHYNMTAPKGYEVWDWRVK